MNPRLLNDLLDGVDVRASWLSKATHFELRIWTGRKLLIRLNADTDDEIFRVADVKGLLKYARIHWPEYLRGSLEPGSQLRATGPRPDKKDKAHEATSADPEIVLVRAHRSLLGLYLGGAILTRSNVDIHERGAQCLLLDGDVEEVQGMAIEPAARIMTIENRKAFLQSGQVKDHVDLVVEATGKMSHRLIAWLHDQEDAVLLHWGDLDPAGLSEFFRLLNAHGRKSRASSVGLFLPDDVERRFEQFGDRKLLHSEKHTKALARLPKKRSEEVDRVADLIRRYGPLMQECFLTSNDMSRDACVAGEGLIP